MTHNPEHGGETALDQWLISKMSAMRTDLKKVLDVEVGLNDAQASAHVMSLNFNLAPPLDVEAGLRAVLPPTSTELAPLPAFDPVRPLHASARALLRSATPVRLTARRELPLDELRRAGNVALALSIGIDSSAQLRSDWGPIIHVIYRDCSWESDAEMARYLTHAQNLASLYKTALEPEYSTAALNRDLRSWVKNWTGKGIGQVARGANISSSRAYEATTNSNLVPRDLLLSIVRAAVPITYASEERTDWIRKWSREWERRWERAEAATHGERPRKEDVQTSRGNDCPDARKDAKDIENSLIHVLIDTATRSLQQVEARRINTGRFGTDRSSADPISMFDVGLGSAIAQLHHFRRLESVDSDDLVTGLTDFLLDLAEDMEGIETAGLNFTGADLRDADLGDINLDGIRWSTETTVWPRGWDDYVRLNSVQIDPVQRPDLYEVRFGQRVLTPME